MRMKNFRVLLGTLCALLLSVGVARSQQSDVLLQGFYWNTHPGDITVNDGLWWDTIATVAPFLKQAGFQTVWTPPHSKGFAGVYDMGYGVYDYYDYGNYPQKGFRTRHGNKTQLQNMISTLHANNLRVMADLVLNHRAGAEGQQLEEADIPNDGRGRELRYTDFRPLSGRLLADSSDFHPNFTHNDLNPPYRDRIFFEDLSYFNHLDQVLNPNLPNNGWYFGPHNLGRMGDSLIVWGRHLLDSMKFDEIRLDAVKHIEPGFLAPFLVELRNGDQPFAVGELFDYNAGTLAGYQREVEGFVGRFGIGSKNANMAVFDFSLRGELRDMANNTSGSFDMRRLSGAGLLFGQNMSGFDIVTFVDNHDVDRIGYRVVDCSTPNSIPYGNVCLELYTDGGHDPVVSDKHLPYAYIMAAEGRPTVFWKDLFWYGLDKEIVWLMALRSSFAKGTSNPFWQLNPFPSESTIGPDLFALRRNGSGNGNDGTMFLMNDSRFNNLDVFLNAPNGWAGKELKDYSDAFMFVQTTTFADGRAQFRANTRNYSWYAPTGQYPKPAGEPDSKFTLGSHIGAKLGFVVLRNEDAANLLVNGEPLSVGDQVAILPMGSNQAVGLGRIGQSFQWDGVHDMIIEVLGGANTAESKGGLLNGQTYRLAVYNASEDRIEIAGTVNFAANGTGFQFSANRPGSRGGSAPFNLTANNGAGTYQVGSIALVTGFSAGLPICRITGVSAGQQSVCDPQTNTYSQQVIVTFSNAPASGNLVVNGQSFAIGTSPQTVTLTGLTANAASVDVNASFSADNACSFSAPALFVAPADCTPPPFAPLTVAALCSPNPDAERSWQITNPNAESVQVTWSVTGTAQLGTLSAAPGTTNLETETVVGAINKLVINWLDNLGATFTASAVSDGTSCGPIVVRGLTLTSLCSADPTTQRCWRVRNPNPFAVRVTWEVYKTPQQGEYVAQPGDSFFFTNTVAGANTTILRWRNELGQLRSQTKASSGAACSSGREAADWQESVAQFRVFPNPFQGEFQVDIPESFGKTHIKLIDPSGRLVYQQRVDVEVGGTSIVVDFSSLHLPVGLYILRAEGETGLSTQAKIVKE